MSIRKQATDSYQFRSEMSAANGIIVDKKQLWNYFSNIPNFDDQYLLRELMPLEQLARIISSTHITGAEDEVKEIYRKYNGDGLKLIVATEQINPSRNKQEKLEGIELAIKIFTIGTSHNNKILSGKEKSPFSSECSDEFKDIDAIPMDIQNPITRLSNVIATNSTLKDNKPKSRITQGLTWGRKKN